MYTGPEPEGSVDNSRIYRSKRYENQFSLVRDGTGKNITYTIIWREGKKSGTYFLVTRKSAAKKILSLYRQGYYRAI